MQHYFAISSPYLTQQYPCRFPPSAVCLMAILAVFSIAEPAS
ncbi:MAG: hypothetical protein ACFB0G_02570 [Leptolyngbyaceae cyanobacterium]